MNYTLKRDTKISNNLSCGALKLIKIEIEIKFIKLKNKINIIKPTVKKNMLLTQM